MRDSTQVRLPDEYLIEIGKISVQWSLLESIFDLSLMKLAGMSIEDPRAWSIFAHMTFPLKLNIFGSLVTELQPKYPRLANYPEVKESIKKAQEGRNMIVHAKWGFENGKVEIARLTARGQIKTSMRQISIDELRQIVEQVGRASIAIYQLTISSGDGSE